MSRCLIKLNLTSPCPIQQASDPDDGDNAEIDFNLKNKNLPPSQMPFAVSPSGDVYSTRAFNDSAPEKYTFEVVAGNPEAANNQKSEATVQINLINDTHRMVMVIPDLSPEALDSKRDDITK